MKRSQGSRSASEKVIVTVDGCTFVLIPRPPLATTYEALSGPASASTSTSPCSSSDDTAAQPFSSRIPIKRSGTSYSSAWVKQDEVLNLASTLVIPQTQLPRIKGLTRSSSLGAKQGFRGKKVGLAVS